MAWLFRVQEAAYKEPGVRVFYQERVVTAEAVAGEERTRRL
jgi:hypothetical protein